MKKVCIVTARPIGDACIAWAENHTPPEFELVQQTDEADIIISVLYNKILSPQEIENKKCFNFHPGILPEYKGTGIYSWVIINEENKTGVTLHLLDKGVDTGDVIEIREFLIADNDTAYSLFLRGEKTIFKMFKDWYVDLLEGDYCAVPQKRNYGSLYRNRDLKRAKNLTRFAKAFYFPNKESAFYINAASEKIYLNYSQGNNNEKN